MAYGLLCPLPAGRTPGVCCLFTMTGFALLSCLLPLSTDHYRLRLGSACGLACLCLAAPVCVLSVYKKKGARMGRGLCVGCRLVIVRAPSDSVTGMHELILRKAARRPARGPRRSPLQLCSGPLPGVILQPSIRSRLTISHYILFTSLGTLE